MARFTVSTVSFLIFSTCLMINGGEALAADTEETTSTLPSLVVSATGYEIPKEQVSADITVITAEDIAHMPVHETSEVLNYITGVDIQRGGGPGNATSISIQGSDFRHVKVTIDGIPIENLSASFPDLSILPLENISRIEVMKGSASSVWGSSLGGVINIITKEHSEKLTARGGIALGENRTNSYNAGLSGQGGGVGYFFSVSRFETDGFHDFQEAENNYIYGKLTKDLNPKLKATATYSFSDINREDSGWPLKENSFEQRIGLALDYKPLETLEYELSGYNRKYNVRSDIVDVGVSRDVEDVYGGTFRSTWRHSENGAFSLGAQASHGELELNEGLGWEDFDQDKTAVFANESLAFGRLTLNAGVRYDHDSVFGSETSPSAGAVYDAGHATLFRMSAARGFSTPPLPAREASYVVQQDNDLNAERAWTYQAGVESGAIPGIWGKILFYRADVEDGLSFSFDDADIDANPDTFLIWENIKKLRRQGVEVEAKTREYRGLVLSYGYAFNDVRDLDAHATVKGQARIIHNAGIEYKGPFDIRATLNGHWVWWNADESANAKDKTWVLDAKVSKYFAKWKYAIGEVFISVHNITDQDQYWVEFYPNPGRWVEAGINLTTF